MACGSCGLPERPAQCLGISGVLHDMKPSGRVSSACRTLMLCNSPRLLVPLLRLSPMLCPNCRPPRSKTLKTGRPGRGGLRFGQNGAGHGA